MLFKIPESLHKVMSSFWKQAFAQSEINICLRRLFTFGNHNDWDVNFMKFTLKMYYI